MARKYKPHVYFAVVMMETRGTGRIHFDTSSGVGLCGKAEFLKESVASAVKDNPDKRVRYEFAHDIGDDTILRAAKLIGDVRKAVAKSKKKS